MCVCVGVCCKCVCVCVCVCGLCVCVCVRTHIINLCLLYIFHVARDILCIYLCWRCDYKKIIQTPYHTEIQTLLIESRLDRDLTIVTLR